VTGADFDLGLDVTADHFVDPGLLQMEVYPCLVQRLITGDLVETFDDTGGGNDGIVLADDAKAISTVVDFDPETTLEQPEVFVDRTAEVGQAFVVVRLEGQLGGVRVIAQETLNFSSPRQRATAA
jgi:hypothetical protein